MIDELEVKDIPLQGSLFTLIGVLNNQRMARLEWFLVSEDLDNHFRGVAHSESGCGR